MTAAVSPSTDSGAASAVEDLFLARTVPFAFHGARLQFDLATTVFSSAGVDPGSALLLRHLQTVSLTPGARILDLGCGHGVLGIVLQSLDPTRHVTYVDRDALACRYTTRNRRRNGQDGAPGKVLGSLGYDQLGAIGNPEPFDLIVSNIPGKAGDAVIAHLMNNIGPHGRVGTVVAVVVVTPLAPLLAGLLSASPFDVLVDQGNKTHHVFIARIVSTARMTGTAPTAGSPSSGPSSSADVSRSGFAAGIYDRQQDRFRVGDLEWTARTVTGIDEFDSLSHATHMLRGAMRGVRAGPCVIVNPGQGHRAVIAARSGQQPLHLISRDLLALEASARCLDDNGLPEPVLIHDVSLEAVHAAVGPSTVIIHADDKGHTPWFIHQVQAGLSAMAGNPGAGAHLLLSGRAGLIGRIEAEILNRRPGRIAHKQGRHGYRVVRFTPR